MAEKKQVETLVYETQESLYEKAVNTMNMDRLIVQFAFKIDNYLKAAVMFDEVGDYSDASELAQKCRELAEQTKQEEKEYKYQLAVKQKKNAKTIKGFEKAEKLLDEISGYRDANELYDDCVVQQKILLKRQKVKKGIHWTILLAVVFAAVIFFLSPSWNAVKTWLIGSTTGSTSSGQSEGEITLENAQAGDLIKNFGGHEWYVLERGDGWLKMIMFHAENFGDLRHMPFNEELTNVTWETSSIRKWLNGEFLEQTFTEEEQEQILTVNVENKDNAIYGTSAGNDTEDKVFLLSADEVEQYFEILKNIRLNNWLRTPGHTSDTAAFMSSGIKVMNYGYPVSDTEFFTCPVICVSTN